MSTRVEIALYRAIALVAGVGSWTYNLRFATHGGSAGSFFRAALATSASTSVAVDLWTMCLLLVWWIPYEGRRVRVRATLAYVVAGLVVAMATALPLFLVARRRAIDTVDTEPPTSAPLRVIAPAIAALAATGIGYFRWRAGSAAGSIGALASALWATDPARSWVFDLSGIFASFVVLAIAEQKHGTVAGAGRCLAISALGCGAGFPIFLRALHSTTEARPRNERKTSSP